MFEGNSEILGMEIAPNGHKVCNQCHNTEAEPRPVLVTRDKNHVKSTLRCECGNIITVETELYKRNFWESNLKGMFKG